MMGHVYERSLLFRCAEIVLWRSVTFCNIRSIDYSHLPMSPIRFPVISLENVVLHWNPVVILFFSFRPVVKLHFKMIVQSTDFVTYMIELLLSANLACKYS